MVKDKTYELDDCLVERMKAGIPLGALVVAPWGGDKKEGIWIKISILRICIR